VRKNQSSDESVTTFNLDAGIDTAAVQQDTSRPAKGKRGTEKEKGEENQQ
jgi:hypothetical protein